MIRSSKIWTIIAHEYTTKIKNKAFIIGTLIAPIALVVLLGVPILTAIWSEGQTTKKIAIVDRSNEIGKEVVKLDTAKYFLSNESEEVLYQEVLDDKLDGYLIIPENILEDGEANVYTKGGGGLGFLQALERNVGWIVRNKRLLSSGADESVIELVNRGINIETKKITDKGLEEDHTEFYAAMGYILGFAIYGLMFIYGSFVSRGVIEEKANRIIEVIASSARPFEIMFGKVVAIGSVGLTQVLIWITFASIILTYAGSILAFFGVGGADMSSVNSQQMAPELMAIINMPTIDPWIIVAFVFYFLIGYFIYASLFAAIGSAVDQEQDAAQLQLPVTLPIIIPILMIYNIMANPDSTLAVVMSLIPFFTPILMTVRIAATNVPFWQVATSVVLNIGTFLGALWVAARIYRIGILMYGKKPSFKDLFKWIKLSR